VTDYTHVKKEQWTAEEITEHLKNIGVTGPIDKPKSSKLGTTAPQQKYGSSRYVQRGGERW
jgi:hypothetical protein